MLYENVIDEVSSRFPHRYLNITKKSKIFPKLPTSRGHRNFSTGQKNLIPTDLESSLLIFLLTTKVTGGPPRVKIKY